MIGEDFKAAEALERVVASLEETAKADWRSVADRLLAVQALVMIRDGAPHPAPADAMTPAK